MQFSRDDEWYQVVRITGPTHNLLGLKFGEREVSQPIIEAISVDDGEATIIADTIKQQVLEGVAEANAEARTDYKVVAIRYVVTDTPSSSIYRSLAKALVEQRAHLASNPRMSGT
jgi:hypothetical protein